MVNVAAVVIANWFQFASDEGSLSNKSDIVHFNPIFDDSDVFRKYVELQLDTSRRTWDLSLIGLSFLWDCFWQSYIPCDKLGWQWKRENDKYAVKEEICLEEYYLKSVLKNKTAKHAYNGNAKDRTFLPYKQLSLHTSRRTCGLDPQYSTS